MSKRVLALVTRAGGGRLTDKTPVTIWEHEIPILEVVHGEGCVQVLDISELVGPDNTVTVLAGTNQVVTKEEREGLHPGLKGATFEERPLDEVMTKNLNLDKIFEGDPRDEFERLGMKYGMNMEIPISNCQFVYGRFDEGRFTEACGVKEYHTMSVTNLRKMLDKLGVEYEPRAPKAALVSLAEQHDSGATH